MFISPDPFLFNEDFITIPEQKTTVILYSCSRFNFREFTPKNMRKRSRSCRGMICKNLIYSIGVFMIFVVTQLIVYIQADQ